MDTNEDPRAPKASSRAIASDGVGLGLRPSMYGELFERRPSEIDFYEIISENFMGAAAIPARNLARVATSHALVLHGVGLNLLGHEELDERYLDALKELADRVDAPYVTDHLCWTGSGGNAHHDLLPTPYTPDLVDFAAERARYVQGRIGRPFALENLSSYVEFRASTMSEWEFYTRVVEAADCRFMFDINNVYVSSVNHGFDPNDYLDAIDYQRVVQVHLAGHDRDSGLPIVDTHDRAVSDEVWSLYEYAYARGGPFPTLLEWDASIPPLDRLLVELARVREHRRRRA